ncbi:autotransporter-associated beta strand repeat-containing protein [Luteolibacter luteus]|uniref:Uncharacterized protein n=1 Tax=Luteolibacter luteus TaxID=2728835 RepID=A0A858RPB0_9BACT|nr:autotransporter-associated beta strand repeat-containing protein [Luteolibacter luteus]QJE98692.1 hypothetical protein HHL09_23885 [Luteolibacter luteus]
MRIRRLRALALLIWPLLVTEAFAQRQMESLGRGVMALRKNSTQIYIGWRLLGNDPQDVAFNLYRSANGGAAVKLNASPLAASTNYTDTPPSLASVSYTYSVRPVLDGSEVPDTWANPAVTGSTLPANPPTRQYFPVPIQPTPDGAGHKVKFCWVGDLDGDGEYDFVIDRHHPDTAARQFLEAYKRDGTFLWRMDMGPNSVDQYNIEPGSSAISIGHGDNVTVYDMDGDGKAEVIVRTAKGVVLPDGTTITAATDNIQYLSVIDGLTGAERARATVPNPYIADGPLNGHMGIFYADGQRPSVLLQAKNRIGDGAFQGLITAWDFRNGVLSQRWSWDDDGVHAPEGHQIRIGDPDNDGKDEFCDIGFSIDDNGSLLYSIGEVTHGDRFHTTDIDPDRPGLETYIIQQNNPSGLATALFDSANGSFIKKWYAGAVVDVGRGVISDMDSAHKGYEMFSTQAGIFNAKGEQIYSAQPFPPEAIWWDADLGREFIATVGSTAESPAISKFNPASPAGLTRLYTIYNETPPGVYQAYGGRPAFWGDILGDWREELLCVANDNSELRIYTTKLDASNRVYALMHNPQYRCQATTKGYVQASYTDYYLGHGMTVPQPPPMVQADLAWRGGAGSSQWDLGATSAWTADGVARAFASGKTVRFDIGADATTPIVLSGTLNPGNVAVYSPKDQTLDGSGGSLSGSMKLMKAGSGSFTITGSHSYNGSTTIWDGALNIDGTLAQSPVTVWGGTYGGKGAKGEKGGRLGGSGSIGQAVTLQYRGAIAPGNGMGHAATLSLAGGLSAQDSSVFALDLSDDPGGTTRPNDKIAVTGNLTLAGAVHIHINALNGQLAPGTYTLLTYSGSLTGSLANLSVTIPPGTPHTLAAGGGAITLEVPVTRAPTAVTWRGSGTAWDLASSPNWLVSGASGIFVAGDSVAFDGSGAASSTVDLKTILPTSGVTVDSATNYSFTGSGSLSGSGGLTKSGSGTLALGTVNDYTGPTRITGGVLAISSLGDAGSPGSIGAASASAANLVIDGGALRLTGSQTNTNRDLSFGPSGATLEVALGNSTMQISGTASGGGKLVKAGPGTLILASANTYSGGTVVDCGTIYLAGATPNSSGLGTGNVTLNKGTLSMANVQASETAAWNMIVPSGGTGRLNADGRCTLTGSLTGSGDFTFHTPYVRTELQGNWSAFTGRIFVITDSDGGDFRIRSSAGYPLAALDLANDVYAYYQSTMGSDLTLSIGTLSGASESRLLGGPTANRTLTWQVGARNESSTFAGVIGNSTGPTALTKTGSGVLTLTGPCTYTGATNIQQGTLRINGATSGTTITVQGGAALGGSGSVTGNVQVQGGGILEHGAISGAPLSISGNLILNGPISFRPGTMAEAGTYTVATFTGSLAGTQQFTWLPPQGTFLSASFNVVPASGSTPGRIELTLTPPLRPPATLVWSGTADSGWNSANWLLDGNAASFSDGDTARFTDAGNATSPVVIATDVVPTAVLVESTKNYTFSGSGLITGNASLTKAGSGTLNLMSAHTYSGGTFLNGGTLYTSTEAAMAAIGTGPIVFNGGTLQQLDNTATYSSASYSIQVPAGQTGTLRTDSRMDLSGSLSGSGTLNVHVPWLRFKVMGNWSAFGGTLNLTTDADGGLFRLANTAGLPSASLSMASGVTTLSFLNQNHSIPMGSLSGPAGSFLSGIVPDNNTPGAYTVTWKIGDRNIDSTFAGVIQNGSGTSRSAIEKSGRGTLVLSGTNTYTGPTTVSDGKLLIDGSLANTATTVASSGTLGGNGSIAGAVTVHGTLSPGSGAVGTLACSSGLVLSSSSKLSYELGSVAASDKLQVAGPFTLDGSIDVSPLPGFGAGTYTLAAYSGTLTDNGLAVGTLPDGFTATVEASGGSVRLVVVQNLSAFGQWQLEYFGSASDPEAAPDADPDHDGSSNDTEFRLGLDPKNGGASFRATGSLAPSGLTLIWPSAPELSFEIHRSGSLDGPWQTMATVTGTGSFTDTAPPEGKCFYRIVLLP